MKYRYDLVVERVQLDLLEDQIWWVIVRILPVIESQIYWDHGVHLSKVSIKLQSNLVGLLVYGVQ
jgi:hypothetical protein